MDDRVAEMDELNPTECFGLLARKKVGRIGLQVDGGPEILPVNYAIDGQSVLFRTSTTSVLNQAAGQVVAFEVDEVDPSDGSGWSVLVKGRAQGIADAIDGTSERLRALPLPTWAPGSRDRWFHLVPDKVTGRRLRATTPDL